MDPDSRRRITYTLIYRIVAVVVWSARNYPFTTYDFILISLLKTNSHTSETIRRVIKSCKPSDFLDRSGRGWCIALSTG